MYIRKFAKHQIVSKMCKSRLKNWFNLLQRHKVRFYTLDFFLLKLYTSSLLLYSVVEVLKEIRAQNRKGKCILHPPSGPCECLGEWCPGLPGSPAAKWEEGGMKPWCSAYFQVDSSRRTEEQLPYTRPGGWEACPWMTLPKSSQYHILPTEFLYHT